MDIENSQYFKIVYNAAVRDLDRIINEMDKENNSLSLKGETLMYQRKELEEALLYFQNRKI